MNTHFKKNKSKNGFSLYEILITLLILSVIMSIALPNLSKMISDYKKERNLDVLNSAIYMAKNFAINNRKTVSLDIGDIGNGDNWESFKIYTNDETIFEYENLEGFVIKSNGKINFNMNGQVLDKDNKPISLKEFCIGNNINENTKYILKINYLSKTSFEERNDC